MVSAGQFEKDSLSLRLKGGRGGVEKKAAFMPSLEVPAPPNIVEQNQCYISLRWSASNKTDNSALENKQESGNDISVNVIEFKANAL